MANTISVTSTIAAPMPIRRYNIDDVARAHRDLESGATVGKLILVA